ncbi:peptidase s41 family protein [Anaeramoeba flamelloides]|uniref:Peptidase s41 family protein n=1 Tax=Anaeramoeba flamelloides TaxID=1746091 RepID=A0ABQ8X9B3_9EUKA|nr:peptidase s41 family protein [Anaeramoeba flamelloides]
MISYSQLNECVSQVENDPLNQKKVVDTTLGVLQQYAFKNLVKDSGTPYNIKVNLVSELEKIRSPLIPQILRCIKQSTHCLPSC